MNDHPSPSAPDLAPVRRALVSVTDKDGLVPFVRGLVKLGVEIISTGGTAGALAAADIPVTPIERVTGFPEIMDGRVKTLHPLVHGGILARRDDPEHRRAMREHGIEGIDLVCVNLYAFEKTVARPGVTPEEAIENIDIGGPSMVRSAAKNYAFVAVVTDPRQYDAVLGELTANGGSTSAQLRASLAAQAFALTARYDAAIAAYTAGLAQRSTGPRFPETLTLSYAKLEDLRYGENPHQGAALYRAVTPTAGPTIVGAAKLHGKELSYNNVADGAAVLELLRALAGVAAESGGDAAIGACVVKHTNPCGAALATTCLDAADLAIAGDPLAAYGGILGLTAEVDGPTAARLCRNDVFLEVIVAPGYSQSAIDQLTTRWANLRLLAVGPIDAGRRSDPAPLWHKFIPGGLLVQEQDRRSATRTEIAHRAGPPPSEQTLAVVSFLEAVGRALTSNAVAIGGLSPERETPCPRLFGGGAGQMDRLQACKIAVKKAGDKAKGAVAFSDAFFPFPDGPQRLIDAGVTTIAHPGGSKRDQETFDLCAKHGVTCLTTGLRHFRH